MPRERRRLLGGYCYHILNRGNRRQTVFHKDGDYAAFLALMAEASIRRAIRILAYCLMPNHFHFVLWPYEDADISRWMHWLMTTHVRRYHAHYHTNGHLWQGPFKDFPIQDDEHLLTVIRYVERNPVRANLVTSAVEWPWSSIGVPPSDARTPQLSLGPMRRGADWLQHVDQPLTEAELKSLRRSLAQGAPFGDERFRQSQGGNRQDV